MERIFVKNKNFVDEYGRERIFNGFNSVYKGIKSDEDGIIRYKSVLNEENITALKNRGVNIIRLGLTWAAIEPKMEEYNIPYLEGYKKIVKLCEKNSIYCLVDFHQDLYSPFGRIPGDGAPLWACTKKCKSAKPLILWAEGYFLDRSVQTSFDDLWNNKEKFGRGLTDRYCDMLTFVTEYLNDCSNIIGYDVLNEPFPGSKGMNIFLTLVRKGIKTIALDSRVDRKKLIDDIKHQDVMKLLEVINNKNVYHSIIDSVNESMRKFDIEEYNTFLIKAAKAIRKIDKNGIIFAENNIFSNIGIPCSVPRIKYEDGTVENNMAFAPHGYDITVDSPLTNKASPERVDFIFDEHKRTQQRLDCPVVVGEWGGMVPGDKEYPALEHLIDKFDKNKWSQTYWQYFKSLENEVIMDIISRPLPQAVAGHINYYTFDRKLNEFTLSYEGTISNASTIVYLPKKPKNIYCTFKYSINDENILKVEPESGRCIIKIEF